MFPDLVLVLQLRIEPRVLLLYLADVYDTLDIVYLLSRLFLPLLIPLLAVKHNVLLLLLQPLKLVAAVLQGSLLITIQIF